MCKGIRCWAAVFARVSHTSRIAWKKVVEAQLMAFVFH
jgi:hypothetical protein